jgi:RNA polymerase sigma factor (sigma-70 family)
MKLHDHSPSDATLVARMLAGEREAFGPLLLRYYPSVLRLCRRLLGPVLAQDVAQETALQSFLNLAHLQEPARFGAWLHGIAANLARMELRKRRLLSLDTLGDGAPLTVLWSAGAPTPEEVHAAREVHDAIVAALGELSTVNREVVIGFYLEGYSYAELAELLGVPVSTIKGRLFKGRRQLQRTLEPLAHEVLKPDRRGRKEPMMDASELVELQVDSVKVSLLNQSRVLMLHEVGAERALPIWVGAWEGDAIALALAGRQPHRPMTHDLALRLVESLGAQVRQVVVNTITENTYYAEITLVAGEQTYKVDARPSDAIALAVRVGAPVYAARAVIDQAGVPIEPANNEAPGYFERAYGSSNFLEPPQRPFFYRTWSYLTALLNELAATAFFEEASAIEWAERFPAHDIVWEGQPMRAVHLPYNDAAAASELATADKQAVPEQTAFLLVPPAFWEEMSAIAQELIEQHRRAVAAMPARSGPSVTEKPAEQQE